MTPFRKVFAVWPLLALLSLCLGLPLFCDSAFAAGPELCVEDQDGAVLYSMPAHEGMRFAIRYTHSVAQSPVTDYFLIKNNSIWLDRTVYHDFGAGLPHAPEGAQTMRTHKGEVIISNYNRDLGSFQLRVGRVANHILLLMPDKAKKPGQWHEIPLDAISPPGSAITFAVRLNKNP